MVLGRVLGDRLVAGAGGQRVVRAGGTVAAVGFGLALLVSAPAAALVGFACLGAGMAGVVPIVFRAAGSTPGMPAGVALAAVSSTGYLGFMVGPPIIGALAELAGLPVALGLLVLLGAAVAGLAGAARPGGTTAAAHRVREAAPA
jgi:MFS family permease